jgi:hypothetical protein
MGDGRAHGRIVHRLGAQASATSAPVHQIDRMLIQLEHFNKGYQ